MSTAGMGRWRVIHATLCAASPKTGKLFCPYKKQMNKKLVKNIYEVFSSLKKRTM